MPVTPLRRQSGFLSPRGIAAMLVLLILLFIPLWWLGDLAERKERSITAEKAQAKGTTQTVAKPEPAPAPVTVNNPDAFGMSWGQMAAPAAWPVALKQSAVWMSCHGEPRDGLTQPHKDSCNPYQGDSSCRLVLPILCIQKDGSTPEAAFGQAWNPSVSSPAGVTLDGWAAGQVASTEPVAGFVIGSLAAAHARCQKELGPGWRMAEFHDGQGGWGFVARRGLRLDARYRHWVHINDQPGNCWDKP